MTTQRFPLGTFGVLSVRIKVKSPDLPDDVRDHIVEMVMAVAEAEAAEVIEEMEASADELPVLTDDAPQFVRRFAVKSGAVAVSCSVTLQLAGDDNLGDIGAIAEALDDIFDQLRYEIAMHMSSVEYMDYYRMSRLLPEAAVHGFEVEVREDGSSVVLTPVL